MSEQGNGQRFTRQDTLTREIARDPLAADFLFSLFIGTISSYFKDTNAPQPKNKTLEEIASTMPPMQKLAEYSSDSELIEAIGTDAADILRYVILECPSTLASLPESMEIPEFRSKDPNNHCYQFAVIEPPPDKERLFQLIKAEANGSIYLCHGSTPDRWHFIIKQGLADPSKNQILMKNGSAFGPGISLSSDTSTCINYSSNYPNKYTNSLLGKQLNIVALCEVANIPNGECISVDIDAEDGTTLKLNGTLKDFGWCQLLTLCEACIIRCFFVNLDKDINIDIQNVSSLEDSLNSIPFQK